ncbi:MAG: diadenylate cyclase CdaA [Candidatus Margulisiibacteriota bacterium]|jgi:diadenylate cyclase
MKLFLSLSYIFDIFLVYILVYYFLVFIKATKSFNLIRGMFLIFVLYILSYYLHFKTVNWLLGKFSTVAILLLLIIFQPELRRILERIGRGRLFSPLLTDEMQAAVIIKHILRAIDYFSKEKIGALIAIEISTNLSEYMESGVPLNGKITTELLINLFWPHTPTHDGAIIIREDKIIAARCLLPLTDAKIVDRRLGTRHRAAIGLSEETDALVIIVSEETGVISLAENGNLTRFLTKEALETRLFNIYNESTNEFDFNIFGFKQKRRSHK